MLGIKVPMWDEFISLEKINHVARAENFFQDVGVSQVRARNHDKLARIKVDAEHIYKL